MDVEGRNIIVLRIEHTRNAVHPLVKLIGVNDLLVIIVTVILGAESCVLLGFLIKIGVGVDSVFGSCRYPTLLNGVCIKANVIYGFGLALCGGVKVDSGCKKILSVLCTDKVDGSRESCNSFCSLCNDIVIDLFDRDRFSRLCQ